MTIVSESKALEIDLNNFAVWVFILGGILTVLVVGRSFLIPLAIAILLWSLVDALRGFFSSLMPDTQPLPEWLATLLAIVTILVINFLVYGILAGQVDALKQAAPMYQANFTRLASGVAAALNIEQVLSASDLLQRLDIGATLTWIGGSAGVLLTDIILVIIYLGFLLVEQKKIPLKLASLQRNPTKAMKLKQLAVDISRSVQRYIWIKTIVSMITGFASYVVLSLVGVDFAAVWGLLIFCLNFIPNIGSFLGVIFPSLLTLLQFDTLTPFLIVAVGLGSAQFVIGNVIEPAFMGRTLNMSSFMIILSLTFWGVVWGIAGMFLAVPLMVVTAIVCSYFANLRWIAVLLSADGRLMNDAAEQQPESV